MGSIFITYRQADATAWAIALRSDLAGVFGDDKVILDKDTLHSGNWREQMQHELERCKVVLVVIGPRWLTIADEQNGPRIQLADDVHHQVIALVLSRSDVKVIPVLVEQAVMPRADQLPPDLRKLADQQARTIQDTQAGHMADLAELVTYIQSAGEFRRQAKFTTQGQLGTKKTESQIGRLSLDRTTIGVAFFLMLIAGMFAYLENSPLSVAELTFLFVVFFAVVLAIRWLWSRICSAGWRKT